MEDTRFTYFLTSQDIQSEAIKEELQARGIPVKVFLRGSNIAYREIEGGATSPFPVDILVQENQHQQAKEILKQLNLYHFDTAYPKTRFWKIFPWIALAFIIISLLIDFCSLFHFDVFKGF